MPSTTTLISRSVTSFAVVAVAFVGVSAPTSSVAAAPKVATKTTITAPPSLNPQRLARVKVKVTRTDDFGPSGKVALIVNGERWGTSRLFGGKAIFHFGNTFEGDNKVKARYLGSATDEPSQDSVVIPAAQ